MKKIIIFAFFCLLQISFGLALDWKGLHEEAEKRPLDKAKAIVQNNPDSLEDLYVLGLIYLYKRQNEEAERIFNTMLAKDSENIGANWGKAELLRRRHDLKNAEYILNEIINSEPGFSPAYITLSYIKYTNTDFEGSVRLAYKVIRQGKDEVDLSNFVRAHLLVAGGKGMIAHFGGPLSKAFNGTQVMPNLKKAQSLQPGAPEVIFGFACFYLLAPPAIGGDLKKAKEYLNKTIELDPLFADAYVRLGQAYKMEGQAQKFQMYLDRALAVDPGNELALDIKNRTCKFICVGKE